jgi:hypothetical protein
MTIAPTNCGETCGLVDFTLAIAGDRLLPEERMDLAVQAVQLEKMSQRGAAEKYKVSRTVLQRRLEEAAQTGHPPETESTTEEPALPPDPPISSPAPKKVPSNVVRDGLRALCKEHGATRYTKFNIGAARAYLTEQGVAIPAHLQPKTKATQPSPSNVEPIPPVEPTTPAPSKRILPWNTAVVPAPVETGSDDGDEGRDFDSNESDPIYEERLDMDAVRDDVLAKVIASNRPADFKRAIELLAELDHICTLAWKRKHPEPWNHHDWAHVNSEVEIIHSLTRQRAKETADELRAQHSAVCRRPAAVA